MGTILRTTLALVFIALSFAPLDRVQSTSTLKPANPAAGFPWQTKYASNNVSVSNISVAFGGSGNYPLISYTNDADGKLWFVRPAVGYVGDCGAGNDWNCFEYPPNATSESTSRMKVHHFINSFKVSWVYKKKFVRETHLFTVELDEKLMELTSSDLRIIDLAIYDDGPGQYEQNGPASFVFDEFGNPHIAVVLQFGTIRRLVYAHKVSGTPTTPCNFDTPTRYQCDIIWENTTGIFHDVNIVLTPLGNPRISWFNFSPHSLMYAYPQSSAEYHPNCGPGNNTWRCIIIDRSSAALNFYYNQEEPLLDMAIGPEAPHHIIKARNTTTGETFIRYAKFVGAGGNCGEDYFRTPGGISLVNRWECTTLDWDTFDTPAYLDFSLQVDSYDFPVIAYNKWTGLHYNLAILYPLERTTGRDDLPWFYKIIDNAPMNTGRGAAFAIGEDDRTLIAYMELGPFHPNLKIAYQDMRKRTYLPSIWK